MQNLRRVECVSNLLRGVVSLSTPGCVAELLPECEAPVRRDLATADDEIATDSNWEQFLHV